MSRRGREEEVVVVVVVMVHPGGPDPCPRPPAAVQLWSGIGKGPPRKLKFPEPAAVVEALRSSLA